MDNPCPHCRSRAAAEYLARGRRAQLLNALGVAVAFALMVLGAALVVSNGPPAPVRSRHV